MTRDPHPVYRQYQEEDPVHFVAGKIPRYILTRHADITFALKHPGLTRAVRRAHWDESRQNLPTGHLAYARALREWALYQDPPEHRGMRQSINRITAAGIGEAAAFRQWIGILAEEILGDHRQESVIDVLGQFAGLLSTRVISDLMGLTGRVEPERLSGMITFIQYTFTSAFRPEALTQAGEHLDELHGLIEQALKQRSEAPAVAGMLQGLAREAELGQLPPSRLLPTAGLLLQASQDNVRSTIAAAVLCLLSRPGLWQRARAEEALIPGIVQETLRYEPAVHFIAENAEVDIEIGGVQIRPGDGVASCLAAANRDPAVFERPDEFDPERREFTQVLTFGAGIHRCPGSKLTLAICEEALRTLLRAWPEPQLAIKPAEVQWQSSMAFRQITTLPVRV